MFFGMNTFDIREYCKRWPKFYYTVATVLGPLWWSGVSARGYLMRYAVEGKVLNLGSGPWTYRDERVINVDIKPYPGVSIVASAENLPLSGASVSGVILDNVLEHIEQPARVVREVARVLIPGGTVYIATPFLYPYHSSPSDYSRWTMTGLCVLLGDEFEVVKSGVRNGPFSALSAFLSHVFAMIFSLGNNTFRHILFNVFMIFLLPIKVLDIVFAHFPGAEEVAATLYVVARKKTPHVPQVEKESAVSLLWSILQPHRVMKYLTNGALATIAQFTVLFVGVDIFGADPLRMSVFSFIVSLCVGFILHRFVTFNRKDRERIGTQFILVASMAMTNLGINTVAMYILLNAGLHYLAAQVLVTGTIVTWTYVGYNIIFRHRQL